jgi:hypothetical protein
MSTRNFHLRVAAVILSVAGAKALACEDEHPPVQTTPIEKFILEAESGGEVLWLALDPRGVGLVVPRGDDDNQWIDTEDETGAWHYREWQWWKGHPWGESCRPRFYADLKFEALRDKLRGAMISYRIDGFDCRQYFHAANVKSADAPYWDLVTSVRNNSGGDVEEYAQFFACYTQPNRDRSFWYWDESGELVRFADRGVGHLDGYVAHPAAYFLKQNAIPHCPRGGGRIVGRWRKPVMVSQASPAGWRSVIMLEAAFAAALTQGIEGRAMDYIVFPAAKERSFAKGAEFSVHIRHVMLKSTELPATRRLEDLWTDFEQSHTAAKELAARL